MENSKKICLLTGAGGTLGNAICEYFSDKFHIIGVYRSKHPQWPSQNIEYVDILDKDKFLRNDNKIYSIKADLTNDSDIDKIISVTLARYEKIDILINCASVFYRSPMIESDISINTLQSQFYLNAFLPLKLSLLIARKFWRDIDVENRQFNRNIINISSIAGVNVYPFLSGYSASKAALNMITKHIAEEFKPIGVRANAIAPNTFPGIVPINQVIESIERFSSNNSTGEIHVIDKDDVYYI